MRNPRFREDVESLRAAHPGLFDLARRAEADQGGSMIAERKALEALEKKYSGVTIEHLSMVVQPFPLVFDPAFKTCVDNIAVSHLSQQGSPPRGLVTRAGVEAGGNSPGNDDIHEKARATFDAMSEEERALYRPGSYTHAVFRTARVFLPIRPDMTLEQVRRWWPHIELAKAACYGAPGRKRAQRQSVYADRIFAYDLIRSGGLGVNAAARHAGKQARSFLRRFNEACRDIEGAAENLTVESFRGHVVTCRTCKNAEEKGRGDLYCWWMQSRLGPRSGRVKGARNALDRGELQSGEHDGAQMGGGGEGHQPRRKNAAHVVTMPGYDPDEVKKIASKIRRRARRMRS